ncbi:MAG: hypothetical protein ACI3XM_08110 [Eubacteriales bacterium]
MKQLLVLLGFFIILWLLPYVRIFVKRMILYLKIKKACSVHSWTLRGTHPFWFFGINQNGICDFHIYTGRNLYSVKLFALRYRRSMLVFSDERQYHIRYFLGLIGQFSSARIPIDGKKKKLPAYRFRMGVELAWETATPHQILLLHPVCIEICDTRRALKETTLMANGENEVILGAGDRIYDMQIYSLGYFLGRLEQDAARDDRLSVFQNIDL